MFRQDYQMRVTGDKPTRAQQAVFAVLTEAEAAMKARLAQTTIADMLASLNR
jgi:DNA-binding IscR family transcriptional regulator